MLELIVVFGVACAGGCLMRLLVTQKINYGTWILANLPCAFIGTIAICSLIISP